MLARLSIFHGSFDLKAAVAVAGATPTVLAALIDKSLLRREGQERFTSHELLRQYAFAKVEEQPEARVQGLMRHARYYATQVEAVTGEAGMTPDLIRLVKTEIDNVRLAWETAVERADHAVLGALVIGVAADAHVGNSTREARPMFERAAASLRTVVYPISDSAPDQQLVLGKVLTWYASFLSNRDRGVVEEACRIADEGLRLLKPFDAPGERGKAFLFRGHAWLALNQMEKAIEDCEAAADIFGQIGGAF